MKTNLMKYMLFLGVFLPLIGWGQRESFDIVNVENYNCAAATKVCGPVNQPFFLYDKEQLACTANPTFYYMFDFVGANSPGIGLNIMGANANYVWYGPIDPAADYCAAIENYTAPFVTGSLAVNGVVYLNNQPGKYILQVTPDFCEGRIRIDSEVFPEVNCENTVACTNCITSFVPTPGKYVVSAWVKEDGATPSITSYTKPSIEVSFTGSASTYTLQPEGRIIDGWQRIEKDIFVPYGTTTIEIKLQTTSGSAYFDDIRFFPTDGSMMSYVYDPISLRLMAELDERNYATLYEYDEEGKLIRVKKETEKGIMTIQENRDNIKKK